MILLRKYIDNQYQFNWIPVAIAAGTALGQIGAGVMGSQAAERSQKKQLDFLKSIYKQAARVQAPSIAEQEIDLELLKSLGSYSPEELEANILAGDTSLSDINLDPRLKAAQMQALEKVGDIVSSRGLTQEDMASLEQLRRKSAAENMAKQAAIKQDMQQRGQLGAGQELAMRLQGAQSTDTSMQDLELAKIAQQRALQAIASQADLASGIRSQDYAQMLDEAKALDYIRNDNLSHQRGVQQQNWATRNQANLYNLEKAQNIANQNVALRNQQQQANKGLIAQKYQQELARVNAMSGTAAPVGNVMGQQAAAQAGVWGGIGQAIGGAGSGLMNYFGKQQDTQKG
jgi:hypothetical protein